MNSNKDATPFLNVISFNVYYTVWIGCFMSAVLLIYPFAFLFHRWFPVFFDKLYLRLKTALENKEKESDVSARRLLRSRNENN